MKEMRPEDIRYDTDLIEYLRQSGMESLRDLEHSYKEKFNDCSLYVGFPTCRKKVRAPFKVFCIGYTVGTMTERNDQEQRRHERVVV